MAKVTRSDNSFQPVTLVIETNAELHVILEALASAYGGTKAGLIQPDRDIAKSIYDALPDCD